MKTATNIPFRSDYGFSSPQLLIDINGNIVANTATVSTVEITSNVDSTSLSSGALTVAGGAAITKILRVGDLINTTKIESDSTLTIKAETRIDLVVSNSGVIGTIDDTGLSIPIKNSQINNTVIGAITPATATFSTASVINDPTSSNEVTKKSYVDLTSAVFAIALGS